MAEKKVALAELVFDFGLYPRTKIDSQHVSMMCDAYEAGTEFPPLVVDKKSRRVVDGFHRGRMYKRLDIDKVAVKEKTYANETEMLLDAVRYNTSHGRTLSPFDRAHVLILAEKAGIKNGDLATALCLTADKVESLRVTKSAVVNKQRVAIKQTISHMAGKRLTKKQADANQRLGGMRQLFYVNQVILLIENDLLDKEDEKLLEGLKRLHDLLEGMLVA